MYNNPNFFYYTNPLNYGYMNYGNAIKKAGLLTKLKGIKWTDVLNNTSKTLNVINQAIPIVYQVKPLVNNAKTMFKIANIIKTDDDEGTKSTNINSKTINNIKKEEDNTSNSSNQPAFFL